MIPWCLNASFDATGSVCASFKISLTPRTNTFISFSDDRYLSHRVSVE